MHTFSCRRSSTEADRTRPSTPSFRIFLAATLLGAPGGRSGLGAYGGLGSCPGEDDPGRRWAHRRLGRSRRTRWQSAWSGSGRSHDKVGPQTACSRSGNSTTAPARCRGGPSSRPRAGSGSRNSCSRTRRRTSSRRRRRGRSRCRRPSSTPRHAPVSRPESPCRWAQGPCPRPPRPRRPGQARL